MDFRGQVWKRVWKTEYFGLKLGQDLGNRAAHPPPRIPRSTPPPQGQADTFCGPNGVRLREVRLYFI